MNPLIIILKILNWPQMTLFDLILNLNLEWEINIRDTLNISWMHIKCIAYVIQTHYTVHYHCRPDSPDPSDRPNCSDYKSCSSLNNVYIEYYPGVIKIE